MRLCRQIAIILTLLSLLLSNSFSKEAFAIGINGDRFPFLAYDGHNNQYLTIFARLDDSITSNFILKGQFLDPDGTSKGDEFDLVNYLYTPTIPYNQLCLVFDEKNFRFFAAWADQRHSLTSKIDIYGQLINHDGTFYGAPIVISDNEENQVYVDCSFDAASERFLIVWSDDRDNATSDSDIWGQMVNSNGSLYGKNFAITREFQAQLLPVVANNSTDNNFFVLWADRRSGPAGDIYGRIVNNNGTLNPVVDTIISNVSEDQMFPTLTYNPKNNNYLALWSDKRNDPPDLYDIYAQIIKADGTAQGSNMAIQTGGFNQALPRISFNTSAEKFLLMWVDDTNDPNNTSDIIMQYMNEDYSLLDSAAAFKDTEDSEAVNDIAYNSNCSNFLVGHESRDEEYSKYYDIIGDACSQAPADFTLLYPKDGSTGIPTSTDFRWNSTTDPDGDDLTYALWYCEDSLFAGCTAYTPPETAKLDPKAALLGLIFLLPALLLLPSSRKKGIALLLIIAFGVFSLSFTYACGSSSDTDTNETVTCLKSKTKYYWKVVASDEKGGITHTDTWSFTTK